MRSRRGRISSVEQSHVWQEDPEETLRSSIPKYRPTLAFKMAGLATAVQCSEKDVDAHHVQLTPVDPTANQNRPSVLRRTPHHQQQDQSRSPHSSSDESCQVARHHPSGPPEPSFMSYGKMVHSLKCTQLRKAWDDQSYLVSESTESQSPLYVNNICQWPGCSVRFERYTDFQRHLHLDHTCDAKGTVQWRAQQDLVQRTENQLSLEKQKLQAIECHLNLSDQILTSKPETRASSGLPASQLGRGTTPEGAYGGFVCANEEPPQLLYPKLWRTPLPHLLPDIIESFDFYKYANIRPPYTYASLIRWSILEAPDKQRTLNEIYNWFMHMFFFFRHNNTAWKNAVRHNLSLHKCFVRVEGGKGAVWTVDETEFQRRKKHKFNRDYMVKWPAPY